METSESLKANSPAGLFVVFVVKNNSLNIAQDFNAAGPFVKSSVGIRWSQWRNNTNSCGLVVLTSIAWRNAAVNGIHKRTTNDTVSSQVHFVFLYGATDLAYILRTSSGDLVKHTTAPQLAALLLQQTVSKAESWREERGYVELNPCYTLTVPCSSNSRLT